MSKSAFLTRRIWVIYIFILIFLIFHLDAQKVDIKQENGVTVIYNHKTPAPLPGTSAKVILQEDLVIGRETEKEDHWFSMLGSVAVDARGNIYALDPKDIKIRVFNPEGKLIKTFGRKGQGPGEFSGPGLIKIMPDESITVFDVLSRRITFLALDGQFKKMVSLGDLPRGPVIADSRGFIYQYKIGRGNEAVDELIKYDPTLKPIIEFHSTKIIRKPRTINPYPVRFLYDLSDDDYFLWLLSSTYEIHVIDPRGKTIKRIIRDYNPVEITKEDKDRYMKENPPEEIRGIRFEAEFLKYYPVADRLLIDDQGRIYVRTHEKDDQGRFYHDVFDPEGRYISRFVLPEMEQVDVVKDNKLYCVIRENEEGIPLIKRYSIAWK